MPKSGLFLSCFMETVQNVFSKSSLWYMLYLTSPLSHCIKVYSNSIENMGRNKTEGNVGQKEYLILNDYGSNSYFCKFYQNDVHGNTFQGSLQMRGAEA